MFRQENGPFSPATSGRMLPAGTKALSIWIEPVIDARSDSLPSIFGVVKPLPAFSRSTIKPRITPSSLAQTIAMSAIGALEIHIFAPLR